MAILLKVHLGEPLQAIWAQDSESCTSPLFKMAC